MKNLRFVYAGNRSGVLHEMRSQDLQIVNVLPVVDSWLHRECKSLNIPCTPVATKQQAIAEIERLQFDVFVSAGFPFILPISELKQSHSHAQFLNVHPSPLPDLRGADPIPGAILHQRDAGVSVHQMDDGIDTGPLISQRRIRHHESLDAKFLYHLCFQLEPTVFRDAMARQFRPMEVQPTHEAPIYYTFQESDLRCRETDSDDQLLARIRAFNTPRKGAIVTVEGNDVRVFAASILGDELLAQFPNSIHNEIVSTYEDCLLIRRTDRLFCLTTSPEDLSPEFVGQKICT